MPNAAIVYDADSVGSAPSFTAESPGASEVLLAERALLFDAVDEVDFACDEEEPEEGTSSFPRPASRSRSLEEGFVLLEDLVLPLAFCLTLPATAPSTEADTLSEPSLPLDA